MAVSIRVIQKGENIEEKTFGGRSIYEVLKYLKENEIKYETTKEYEEIKEISQNVETMFIFINNINVLGLKSMANFIKEYSLEYDETVYRDLQRILTS